MMHILSDSLATKATGTLTKRFFFPASAYWPVWPGQSTVSVGRTLSRSAHCAGEKVKRKKGPFQWKSL